MSSTLIGSARRVAIVVGLITVALLSGCESPSQRPAPVVDRGAEAGRKPALRKPGDTLPEFYTVKKGDTLYAIAVDHGLDYKDLAAWNGLTVLNRLTVGQQLRLRPPGAPAGPASAATPFPRDGGDAVTVAPLATVPSVEGKPLGAEPAKIPPPGGAKPAEKAAAGELVKGPRAQRLPYSEEAVAQLKAAPSPFAAPAIIAAATAATTKPAKTETLPGTPEAAKPEAAKPDGPKAEVAKIDPKPDSPPESPAGDDEDRVDWSWPTNGKVVSPYSEGSNLKGIGIGGRTGQPVLASAAGRVVYAGSGLRGYGKLVIIKHNKTYLSVYAHNSEILVKEGQNVTKGQKIAEMGNSDADQVKLHFEIRRLGKPVDPLKFLPVAKG